MLILTDFYRIRQNIDFVLNYWLSKIWCINAKLLLWNEPTVRESQGAARRKSESPPRDESRAEHPKNLRSEVPVGRKTLFSRSHRDRVDRKKQRLSLGGTHEIPHLSPWNPSNSQIGRPTPKLCVETETGGHFLDRLLKILGFKQILWDLIWEGSAKNYLDMPRNMRGLIRWLSIWCS